jgi:DNA-binding response OmpR family regulator
MGLEIKLDGKMLFNSKILIVEDNPITASDLKKALLKLHFEVTDITTSYETTLISINQNEPDIIMMDIDLGDNTPNGIELTNEIHKTKNIPVLYLTAFSDDETMEKAFQTNPVGYLIKPFRREEVKATILLALYKINTLEYTNINQDHTYIGFGYYFDTKTQKLYYKSKYIKLGYKERILIDSLIQAKGAIVPSIELEHKLWADNTPSNSSLRTLIYRLHLKLGCKLIFVSYSNGYQLSYNKK